MQHTVAGQLGPAQDHIARGREAGHNIAEELADLEYMVEHARETPAAHDGLPAAPAHPLASWKPGRVQCSVRLCSGRYARRQSPIQEVAETCRLTLVQPGTRIGAWRSPSSPRIPTRCRTGRRRS